MVDAQPGLLIRKIMGSTQHLSSRGISMYLIGDVSAEERQHLQECSVCQAELSSLETSIAVFRGAVRQWSDQVGTANQQAAALRWTVIPGTVGHPREAYWNPDNHLDHLLLPASLDAP
jgi:hypothetical protein